MSKPTIGFIGLGLMGHGMAMNIQKAGYPLVALAHRKRDAIEALIADGATEVKTPRDMAQACDMIHLCVTGSAQVEANLRGPNGVLSGLKPGAIIIDCSTSDPVSTLAMAEETQAADGHFADAPLARTPKEAWSGTLDTMVGADAETFAKIKPVLETWAGVITHLGPVGLGHKMKLINNFIAMGYAALYAEALAISRKAGLTVEQVDSVIRPGRLSNGFYETFMSHTLTGVNAHEFAIANAHKDMKYLSNLANEIGAVNPMQSVIKNAFGAMEASGQGDKHVPMLADFIATQNGVDPKS